MSNLAINAIRQSDSPPHGREPPESLYIRVYKAYAGAIAAFVSYFENGILFYPVLAFATILLEPGSALRVGCEGLYYLFKYLLTGRYSFSGINPRALDDGQRGLRPVLFLHGNLHSPAACTAIASALARDNDLIRPIFTVQLKAGELQPEDDQRINAKIEEIKALYHASDVDNITIDLIGHSRGAILARRLADREDINRIVTLGWLSQHHDKVYEINGQFDRLLLYSEEDVARAIQRAADSPNYRVMLGTVGHLGLLYSSEAHAAIIAWLGSPALDLPEE
ncbi:MAG: esterase/lipase family protein [Chlamydiales bacterium]